MSEYVRGDVNAVLKRVNAIMKSWHRLLMVSGVCLAIAGCTDDTLSSVSNKVEHPLPTKVVQRMKAYDMTERSPIMMRIFKEESVLEVWKAKTNGRYEKIAEYDICKWSGELGPKRAEGDRQAPEGFYTVAPHQMNPNSSYYLSFNLGYPNRFDRAHGRTGTNLMVHGACSSAGCYSMTDEQVLEIYAFAREAFKGGQGAFQVQALPFRMTAENMARHRDNPNYEFWKMLKVGYDHFELTKTPPKVDVCDRQYVFNQMPEEEGAVFNASEACPAMRTPDTLQMAYSTYVRDYEKAFKEAVAKQDKRAGAAGSLWPVRTGSEQTAPQSARVTTLPAGQPSAPAVVQPLAAPAPSAAQEVPDAPPSAAASVPVPASAPIPTSNPADAAPATTPASAVQVSPSEAGSLAAAAESVTQVAAAPQAAAVLPATPAPASRPMWKLWSRN